MQTKPFHSIMPMLHGKIGHIFQYNVSLAKVLDKNKWEFFGHVPKDARIDPLPQNWEKILPRDSWRNKKSLIRKISITLQSIPVYFKIFKRASERNGIVFLEHFTVLHLVIILTCLLVSKKKFSLWFLHRYVYTKKKKYLIKCLHNCQTALLGKHRMKLFTDSEMIANDLEKVFKKKITVLPIPHAMTDHCNPFPKKQFLYLWHPGYICQAKGIHEITSIANTLPFSSFKLVISKQAKKWLPLNIDPIVWIPEELSRAEYERWMNTVDMVLLPYDPKVYSHGTSGIFVESILAGKIPVVKDGSWLAFELKKFQLNELILDWEEPNILSALEQLFSNQTIHKKLSNMRDNYQKYYSPENISNILNEATKLTF